MNEGSEFGSLVETQLKTLIRGKIAPFAQPDFIQSAPGLPKTRSGKIMRRVLKKIAAGEKEDFGDISTMADSSVVKVKCSTIFCVEIWIAIFISDPVGQTCRDDAEQEKQVEDTI